MRKILLALTAVAAFTGSAVAADLPAKTYTKAPAAVAPVPTWTGFWISGGFGYAMEQYRSQVTSAVTPGSPFFFDPGHDVGLKGWLGKVGLGYDYQFMGNFVIGAFADAQWSDITGRNSWTCPGSCFGPTQGYTGIIKNDWAWAVGGRVGYVALPGLLTYVNGGYTQANFTAINYVTSSDGITPGPTTGSRRKGGYFVGAGTEYAITQIPGLFWKSEVRFSDFGNKTDSTFCLVGNGVCGVQGSLHSFDRNHITEQAATTELVYRFNWTGPLVAKY